MTLLLFLVLGGLELFHARCRLLQLLDGLGVELVDARLTIPLGHIAGALFHDRDLLVALAVIRSDAYSHRGGPRAALEKLGRSQVAQLVYYRLNGSRIHLLTAGHPFLAAFFVGSLVDGYLGRVVESEIEQL